MTKSRLSGDDRDKSASYSKPKLLFNVTADYFRYDLVTIFGNDNDIGNLRTRMLTGLLLA
jgi:hypothetical protein